MRLPVAALRHAEESACRRGYGGGNPSKAVGEALFIDPAIETYEACKAAILQPSPGNKQQCEIGVALTALGFTGGGKVVGIGVRTTRGLAAAREAAAKACRLNSFTGDTLVLMADGTKKPIKDVRLGDRVMATDPLTGTSGPRNVIDLIRHSGPHTMVTVRLVDGSTIEATDQHPFWVESQKGWVDAIDLKSGDIVVDADGDRLTIASLGISERDLTAYNLTVVDLHTYYAGDDSVLVHNAGGMDGCSDAAYQGILHLRDEIAKEGAGGAHSWAARMSDDALADYLDSFVTRGGGQPLKGGGVGWYDADRGIAIIQRSEYSMTGYTMSYEKFLGKLR